MNVPSAPTPRLAPGEDYIESHEYTHGFIREIAPSWLRFAAQFGNHLTAYSPEFTYYDLGCGQGDTITLLAAVHPRARFIGIDFNEKQIDNARALAREAALANVEFHARPFADLAAMDPPPAEFIVLHGVWSWVNEENRRHVVDFLGRKLKPGGLAYVSYNAMPGNAANVALRRLMSDHADRGEGTLDARTLAAIAFVTRLDEARAFFFQRHPTARERLRGFVRQDRRYLTHEYFNRTWQPCFHADVAADLARAGLAFVGRAKLVDNVDRLSLPDPIADLVTRHAADRSFAETIRDFATDRAFRADVFARPPAAQDSGEALRLALMRPRAKCKLTKLVPRGQATLRHETHAPLLDALARRPMSLSEIAGSPECSSFDVSQVRKSAVGLAAFDLMGPAQPRSGAEDREAIAAARRLNEAQARLPGFTENTLALASPILGNGIRLHPIDHCFIGAPNDPVAAARHALERMPRNRGKLVLDGKAIETADALREAIDRNARPFLTETRPWLAQLGVAV
jgi:SAM-dependent methyltransferase